MKSQLDTLRYEYNTLFGQLKHNVEVSNNLRLENKELAKKVAMYQKMIKEVRCK
jgi:regulator of replication initiation timing